MTPISFNLVDVFSPKPFGGNTLPVFVDPEDLNDSSLLKLTRELGMFEAIFVWRSAASGRRSATARIFDLSNELPFAGHPVLGAAAVLHRLERCVGAVTTAIEVAGRTIEVVTEERDGALWATMDQGVAAFSDPTGDFSPLAGAFGLDIEDVVADLPLQVVSTGLRYAVVPVASEAMERAAPQFDLTSLLDGLGAEFAVLFDPVAMEIRHWNNDGGIEDVATGSAAGVIGSYCRQNGLATSGDVLELSQGRFRLRPSRIDVTFMPADGVEHVFVGGPVAHVGVGAIEVQP